MARGGQNALPDRPELADSLVELALMRRSQRRLSEAVQLARQAVAINRKRTPSLALATHLLGLASILDETGNAESAEPLAKEALDVRRSLLPEEAAPVKEALEKWNHIRRAVHGR